MSVVVCAWISALSSCSWSKLKCVCRSFLWLLIFSALLPHLHFQNFQITSTMSPLTNLSNPVLSIYLSIYYYYYYLKNSFRKFCVFFLFFEFTLLKKNENFQIFPNLFLLEKFPALILSSRNFHYPFTPNLLYLQMTILCQNIYFSWMKMSSSLKLNFSNFR